MKFILTRKRVIFDALEGELLCPDGTKFYTVENNAKRIKSGVYGTKLSMSNRLKTITPEVLDVQGRQGIRIHIANKASELEGCIAIGLNYGKPWSDLRVLQSTKANEMINTMISSNLATLEIIDI